MGMVPGVDDPSPGLTMTLLSQPWEDAGHVPPGRAIVAIVLLFAIAIFATMRFRGFWNNHLALAAALLLAGYTAGPLIFAGGLGLAVAGWKKARG